MKGFSLFNLAFTIKPLVCNTVLAVVKPKSSLHYVGCLEQVIREQFCCGLSRDSFKRLEASVRFSLKMIIRTNGVTK